MLSLTGIIIGVISFIPFIGSVLGVIVSPLWIVSFVQAIIGNTTPLTIIGIYFQTIFSSIFKKDLFNYLYNITIYPLYHQSILLADNPYRLLCYEQNE